jgi:hypothetical protein
VTIDSILRTLGLVVVCTVAGAIMVAPVAIFIIAIAKAIL